MPAARTVIGQHVRNRHDGGHVGVEDADDRFETAQSHRSTLQTMLLGESHELGMDDPSGREGIQLERGLHKAPLGRNLGTVVGEYRTKARPGRTYVGSTAPRRLVDPCRELRAGMQMKVLRESRESLCPLVSPSSDKRLNLRYASSLGMVQSRAQRGS